MYFHIFFLLSLEEIEIIKQNLYLYVKYDSTSFKETVKCKQNFKVHLKLCLFRYGYQLISDFKRCFVLL